MRPMAGALAPVETIGWRIDHVSLVHDMSAAGDIPGGPSFRKAYPIRVSRARFCSLPAH